MGTSQSSGGPGGGVPLVPPWVPDASPPPPGPNPGDGPATPVPPVAPNPTPQPPPLARPGRFTGARRNLGNFGRTGNTGDMRRGLGQYTRNGYGGAGTAARRMGGTALTAGALAGALTGVAGGGGEVVSRSPLDPTLLAGRSADEVMNAVVEAVRPVDGTLDAEASRAAILDGLSELLTRFPDADLLNLTAEQRAFAVERYTANDVFRRIELDVGKSVHEKAPTAAAAVSRLKQIRDYVKETVAASFRKLRDAGRALTLGRVEQVIREAIRETFEVFEGFAE